MDLANLGVTIDNPLSKHHVLQFHRLESSFLLGAGPIVLQSSLAMENLPVRHDFPI